MFYGFFVYISGKYEGYILVDWWMVYMVKEIKFYIKYMCLNKMEKNISYWIRVIFGNKIIV